MVGGRANGLELGNKLGRRGKADVALIDKKRSHPWQSQLYRARLITRRTEA